MLTGVRTAGQVGGAVSISRVDVLRGGCGHLQVDHLPCVLQGRHSVFMQDVLQGHVVHLRGWKVRGQVSLNKVCDWNMSLCVRTGSAYSQDLVPNL